MSAKQKSPLMIGWGSADLTPQEQPVILQGQFYARVSEGVMDPLTVTALALESVEPDAPVALIIVSCDLISIPDALRDGVAAKVKSRVPELDGAGIVLSGTHTHTGPGMNTSAKPVREGGSLRGWPGVDLPVADGETYLRFAIDRVASAVESAWSNRTPGTIGYGLGHAVVGYNRRLAYENGESRMYGNANDPHFSHVEGYEDHSLNLMATWNASDELTGVVVNVACPSQVSEHLFQISADYWHDTRLELRRRLGPDLFVLPQCAAAGDQSPRPMVGKAAEERMQRLMEGDMRRDIAIRIASAVEAVLPVIATEKIADPTLGHRTETVALTRRMLSARDVEEARAEVETWRNRYQALKEDLEAHPEKREASRWYIDISIAYRRMNWFKQVEERYALERTDPRIPVQIQALRIGDIAFATNPFELYLDFGIRIRARSPAVQTFTVQLSGPGSYLPTARAAAGGSYGAVPPSTPVGPEGGAELVEHTLEMIRSLWPEP